MRLGCDVNERLLLHGTTYHNARASSADQRLADHADHMEDKRVKRHNHTAWRAMAMGYNAHGQCDIPVLYTQASTEVDHFEVVSKLLPAVTKTLNHVASQY